MTTTKHRPLILKYADFYYRQFVDSDFSHNLDHLFRVERLAKMIALEERADMEIVEAACLLFDIARIMEDEGHVSDHAAEGAKIAREILTQISFPSEKIDPVCYAISVHRRSRGVNPTTLEAKILQDADYLDAMGAIDIARVIASSLQSKKYNRPI